jgi:hypothetical protein
MIANIASDDALILPHRANPAGLNFRERQVQRSQLTGDVPGVCGLDLAQGAAPPSAYLYEVLGHGAPNAHTPVRTKNQTSCDNRYQTSDQKIDV